MNYKILLITAAVLAAPLQAIAEDDQYTRAIKYRQAAFTIVGANFTPMSQMIKGERPYDAAQFAKHAADLAAVASVDIGRGFIEGSEFGRTKAKEEIWENMDDFKKRLTKFTKETAAFNKVMKGGDKGKIKKAFGKLGKENCKACHKKYKSKEYAE